MTAPVTTERKGYRRGLILGLTMAESMLLLVFCLLLVAAAIINQMYKKHEAEFAAQRDLIHTLQDDKQNLVAENTHLLEQNRVLIIGNNADVNPDEFKKLTWSKQVVDAYEAAGVPSEVLIKLVEEVKLVHTLSEQGISSTELAKIGPNIAALEELRKKGIDGAEAAQLVEDIKVIEAIRNEGVTIEQLAAMKSDIKVIEELKKAGITSEELAKLAPSLTTLKENGLAKATKSETSRQVAETIANGLQDPSSNSKWPPIINLSDAQQFSFESGKALMSDHFRKQLETNITDQIADLLQKYNVDLIEVIGHTDEQPLAGLPSNLDQELNPVMNKGADISELHPSDNAGLGLARAVAVASVLQRQDKLKNATVLPYSAAQLIVPGDTITVWKSGNDKSRRRIEIRVRKRLDPKQSSKPITEAKAR